MRPYRLSVKAAATRMVRLGLLAGLICCSASSLAQAQAAAAEPHFDVFEYRIEGNTVLPVAKIERAVYPHLGERKTAADIEKARASLEAAYREAGFGTVVVDTPEQRIVDAVVVLQVIEAPISRLRVVGSRYSSQTRLLEKVPALAEGQVPNFNAVSEQLAGVNRSADRRVTPLLRPGKDPGTTEADLNVDDQLPLHGSVEINDRYSANTTRSRLLSALRYDNLWQRDHSLGLQVQTSPEDTSQVKVFSASYALPTAQGQLAGSFIRSDSTTVAGVGGVSVFGRGSITGLRHVWFIETTETTLRTLTAGADYKRFSETVSVGSGEGFATPIHYLPMTLAHSLSLGDKQQRWQFGTGLTFAIRGLASRESQFADKRFMARGNFAILKFDVTRSQPLPGGLSFSARLDAQLTDQALISNEQFVAGGLDSVRGYLEATAVGDKGLRGSLEVRSDNLVPKSGWGYVSEARAHVFVEGAGLWLNDPLPQQDRRSGLLGTGIGLRVRAMDRASLSLDLARALRDAGIVKRGDTRLHAGALFEF